MSGLQIWRGDQWHTCSSNRLGSLASSRRLLQGPLPWPAPHHPPRWRLGHAINRTDLWPSNHTTRHSLLSLPPSLSWRHLLSCIIICSSGLHTALFQFMICEILPSTTLWFFLLFLHVVFRPSRRGWTERSSYGLALWCQQRWNILWAQLYLIWVYH